MTIDVFGLSITIPELFWTIVNLIILYFLLKKLLFKPLLEFVDARAARVQAGLDEGVKAEKTLKDTEQLMEDEVMKSNAEARSMIEQARAEASKENEAKLAEARKQSLEIREEIKCRIASEEADEKEKIDEKMVDFITLLSNRLLHSNEASGKEDLIKDCIDAAK